MPRAAPRTSSSGRTTILLRGHGGKSWTLEVDPEDLSRERRYWLGALEVRRRWHSGQRSSAHQASLALGTLVDEFGFKEEAVASASDAFACDLVLEIGIPADAGSDLRSFPWEYVFASWAGSPDRYPRAIVRRLISERWAKVKVPPQLGRKGVLLFVEGNPDAVRESYDYELERAYAEDAGLRVVALSNPTVAQIEAAAKEHQPKIVHLAGCDPHQAVAERLYEQDSPGPGGMVLAGRGGRGHEFVDPKRLARAVCAGERKPQVVVCNLFHSGGDTAASMVAEGADAAVGFQDQLDLDVAEQLIAELYRHHGPMDESLLGSFMSARARTKGLGSSQVGSGVVLWTRSNHAKGFDAYEFRKRHDDRLRSQPVSKGDARPPDVIIDAPAEVNYAMLHNQTPLLPRFAVRKFAHANDRIHAEVALQVGTNRFAWASNHDLTARVTDLAPLIQVPLTWTLESLPSERVRSIMSIIVHRGDEQIVRQSYPVQIAPVDSWIDDDINRQWLPSFVLPRDPAVRRIIDGAQRHLQALADDHAQGFSGYQAEEPESDDPYRLIDAQAQAIWTTIAQDAAVRYINPPPSYALMAQRLRTPSALMSGGRGTCIDLALLLAACLEYVEIYPVVVLLEGHAFVGYWRSEQGYWDFLERCALQPDPFSKSKNAGAWPWVFGKDFFRSIVREVHRTRQLVPLEATGLTWRGGFWEAVDLGTQNLRSIDDFHSVIDICTARDHFVTPLPFAEVQS
jgi:hypothetical protein